MKSPSSTSSSSPGVGRLLGRSTLFALLCLALHGLLQMLWPESYLDYLRFAPRTAMDRAVAEHSSVILFGDSVANYLAPSDQDRRTLTEMFRAEMAPERVGVVAHPALSFRLYDDLTAYMLEIGGRPRAVVVPVNLRQFWPGWDLRPEYQFSKQVLVLRYGRRPWFPLLARPMAVFRVNGSDPVDRDQFLALQVRDQLGVLGLMERFEAPGFKEDPANLPLWFRALYTGPVGLGDRQVEALSRLCGRLQSAGIRPVFYVCPMDDERANQVVPGFESAVGARIRLLEAVLRAHGVPLWDLHARLPHKDFGYIAVPDEHLQQEGRLWLARELTRICQLPEEEFRNGPSAP